MASGPETLHLRSGTRQLTYQVLGDGERHLVVVHGFDADPTRGSERASFGRLLDDLATLGRTVVHDVRGTDTSDPSSRPSTLEEGVANTVAVMDACGFDRTVLIGMSSGVPVATLLAATHPERVSLLVLYGAWARGDAADASSITRWSAIPTSFDLTPALPSIQAPTLVVRRQADRRVVTEHAAFVASHIEGSKYVEVAGEEHLPWEGDVASIVREIGEFVATTPLTPIGFDRVLTTIVATDIVDPASSAAEPGGRPWHEQLDQHDALLRRTLDAFRGSHMATGDERFVATFDGAARAIRWADELRRQVIPLGVEIRTGVHTGELAREHAGGVAVQVSERMCELAAPSEIITSRTVADLVVGSGIEFGARGERELKGVPGIWPLFVVTRC
jgi:pimeloyl-ACP methyl ester carboxylesterase